MRLRKRWLVASAVLGLGILAHGASPAQVGAFLSSETTRLATLEAMVAFVLKHNPVPQN